ncbi:MAG: sigma-70 family RNA polymerase sigma factor, partial [Bacteroidota bacterium]
EVFIKLWKKRDELDAINNLEAWCMRATRNLSIDKLRSKHQRVGMIPEGFDIQSNAATPDRLAESSDTLSRVRAFMEKLPEKQKMVMQLRDIEGLSYQEITEALSMPMNQVKVYLFRARQQIRAQLINSESYGL